MRIASMVIRVTIIQEENLVAIEIRVKLRVKLVVVKVKLSNSSEVIILIINTTEVIYRVIK